MTRKSRTVVEYVAKRRHRTPEQIVLDLQAEIERVKARAAARQATADPQAKAVLTAVKVLDKASQDCTGDAKCALEAARALLSEQLVLMGMAASQPPRQAEEAV